MRKFLIGCIFLLSAQPLCAGEINVPGELSHVAGGAVLAGGFTALAGKYYPNYRKLIGFLASSACVVVGEGIQMSQGETFSSSAQDMGVHMLGAAAGALVTDAFVLTPVLKQDKAGNTLTGLALHRSF